MELKAKLSRLNLNMYLYKAKPDSIKDSLKFAATKKKQFWYKIFNFYLRQSKLIL